MNNLSQNIRNVVAVLLALAVLAFSVFVGVALVTFNGQAQTCARAGGHWVEHFDSTNPAPDAWIDDKQCAR